MFEFRSFLLAAMPIDRCGFSVCPPRELAGCRSWMRSARRHRRVGVGIRFPQSVRARKPVYWACARIMGLSHQSASPTRLASLPLRGISPTAAPERLVDCGIFWRCVPQLAAIFILAENPTSAEGKGNKAQASDLAITPVPGNRARGPLRVLSALGDAQPASLTSIDQSQRARQLYTLAGGPHRTSEGLSEIALDHLYVDNAAMQIVLRPSHRSSTSSYIEYVPEIS